MNKIYSLIAIVLLLVISFACSSSRKVTSAQKRAGVNEKELPAFEHEVLGNNSKPKVSNTIPENHSREGKSNELYAFIKEWEGTPHCMGGNTKKGVDCSGFVIQIYEQVYQSNFLGRRSEDLFSETTPVKKEELREGDLVFFKIYGRRIDHVGIYLSDGKFAHASTSKGVIVSDLEQEYYKKRFFMGGRKN